MALQAQNKTQVGDKSPVLQLFWYFPLSASKLRLISMTQSICGFCQWPLSFFLLNCCFLLRNSLAQWEETLLLPRVHLRPHPVPCLLLLSWRNCYCQNILYEAELWFVDFRVCWTHRASSNSGLILFLSSVFVARKHLKLNFNCKSSAIHP